VEKKREKGEKMEIKELKAKMHEYFVGKESVVEDVLICLLAGGHILLEDVPGVGKTTLARTLSKLMECDFGRIQFTPDTLPGDVIGTTVYKMETGEFLYREGAVMHQILLADEINRTSPKTQSSLLEAMAEGQVTVDGTRHALPKPFLVIATQNPVEFLGTYPLPEAQMDRFMMRISLGYPEKTEELRLAKKFPLRKADGRDHRDLYGAGHSCPARPGGKGHGQRRRDQIRAGYRRAYEKGKAIPSGGKPEGHAGAFSGIAGKGIFTGEGLCETGRRKGCGDQRTASPAYPDAGGKDPQGKYGQIAWRIIASGESANGVRERF